MRSTDTRAEGRWTDQAINPPESIHSPYVELRSLPRNRLACRYEGQAPPSQLTQVTDVLRRVLIRISTVLDIVCTVHTFHRLDLNVSVTYEDFAWKLSVRSHGERTSATFSLSKRPEFFMF